MAKAGSALISTQGSTFQYCRPVERLLDMFHFVLDDRG